MKITFNRHFIFSEVWGVFLFQFILIIVIAFDAYNQLLTNPFPSDSTSAMTRFLAGLIMQIHMQAELQNGLLKMKFCLNHVWKFDRPYLAFSVGLMQTLATMAVVIVNYIAILL